MKTETKVEATPGPWQEGIMQIMDREDDDNYRFIKAGEGYWSRTKKNKGFWLTGYISPADSRMISAAPELLEALENIIGMAEDGYALHKRNGSHQEFLSEDVDALNAAKIAINKAKGL